jgi:hypothetical protein
VRSPEEIRAELDALIPVYIRPEWQEWFLNFRYEGGPRAVVEPVQLELPWS